MSMRNSAKLFPPILFCLSISTWAQVEASHLDTGGGDQFGWDIALRSDVLIVGAPADATKGSDAGAAHIYLHDDRGTNDFAFDDGWTALEKLTPDELSPGDSFGTAIGAWGDLVAIGAPQSDENFQRSGAVYVYERQRNGSIDPLDDSWLLLQKLLPSSSFSTQRFGRYIAIQGDTIVVGMRDDISSNDERVFIFERDDKGTPADPLDDLWIETAALVESSKRERFGWSYDLSSDTLIIGARWGDLTSGDDNSGFAYVYYRDDQGTPNIRLDDTWSRGPIITADLPVIASEFGRQVKLHGDTVIITSHRLSPGGAAYVFDRDRKGTSDSFDDEWIQSALLKPSDGGIGDTFGEGVALGSDVCVVTAPTYDTGSLSNVGKLYVFRRDDRGTPLDPLDDLWSETGRLVGSQLGTEARTLNVSLEGDLLAVGSRQGAVVHIYDLDGALNLDVETEDDWITPLANGQTVSTASSFGRWLRVDGLSASGHEAVSFDSSPSGMNSAGADPDLLVDTGNLLILQEGQQQSVPGIYDTPDDDAVGGTIDFEFMRGVATPLSVDLVDIDAIPNQAVTLTLFDSLGAVRTFYVPSGWTEDLVIDGPPGFRTLDLTTLQPQPGYLAVATATESPGFNPSAVVRINVNFFGSAGMDNLRWNINGSFPVYGSPSTEFDQRRWTNAKRGAKKFGLPTNSGPKKVREGILLVP